MASITSLSGTDTQKLITENAFLYFGDPVIGDRVMRFRDNGFPIEALAGLEFCKQNVLDDQRVRHVLEAIFPWSGLGIYEVYRTDADHIYAFMTGRNKEMNAVVVQLWSPQSSMVVYKGSHLLPIRGFNASNGLLEIPYAPLKQCQTELVELDEGGLVILDARLAFKTLKGFAIHFVFATKEELVGWSKKEYPAQEEVIQKAADMETPTIGVNFSFTSSSE